MILPLHVNYLLSQSISYCSEKLRKPFELISGIVSESNLPALKSITNLLSILAIEEKDQLAEQAPSFLTGVTLFVSLQSTDTAAAPFYLSFSSSEVYIASSLLPFERSVSENWLFST